MLNNFRSWYIRNQDAITWFLIGLLTAGGIDALIEERYISAVINFALAYANYKLSAIRMY